MLNITNYSYVYNTLLVRVVELFGTGTGKGLNAGGVDTDDLSNWDVNFIICAFS